ncbi:MAG TPA: dihydrolipoamide acetyltransferase family protein [Fimbriimonadaceae bacterium]|nr:dihydrolipoamide acetyltransferase family protein [Fimbriimonadaceae bacterium]
MQEVIMPKMGDGMEEGTLLEWLKKEGDKVKSGEVIGTIQTDKATLELEAPSSGILQGFLIKSGDTVPVGHAIAAIVKEGEALPEGWKGGEVGVPGHHTEAGSTEGDVVQDVPPGVVGAEAAKVEAQVASEMGSKTTGRVIASPLARRIASEKGLDLSAIRGTGPGGRIVEKDVIQASPPESAVVSAPGYSAPKPEQAGEDQEVKLNRLRQITAQRTTQSKQQVPHFYVTVEVDVEKLMALREMFEEEESGKVSVNDFVVRASALALREMPNVNATYNGQTVTQHGSVNIGLAVALDDGLTVAVIKNADQLGLRQISAASRDLAGKARSNKLTPDELSGSTFAISNMGMLDVDDFVAIINQPNAAILAIASARKKVVVGEDDEIEVRRRMNITGSFDHRVVDGAVGARFMNLVRAYLENPTRLFS